MSLIRLVCVLGVLALGAAQIELVDPENDPEQAEIAAAEAMVKASADEEAATPKPSGVAGVAILSPLHKTHKSRHERYVRNLLSLEGLDRPRCRLAFLVAPAAMKLVQGDLKTLRDAGFGDVVVGVDGEDDSGETREYRHKPSYQRKRRGRLARARNVLVGMALSGLFGESLAWTLWLDSDLASYPRNLLARLLQGRAAVVAPYVLDANSVLYDKNTWAHSDQSRHAFEALGDDESLVVQGGYRHAVTHVLKNGTLDPSIHTDKTPVHTQHDFGIRHLDKIIKEDLGRRFHDVDAVGTACLLVSADVFRQGVIFPDTPVNHLIESEGFGYLAREKGFTVVADLETYVKHA